MILPANIRQITALDTPELQPYRTLRRAEAHLQQGIFVAEGEKVVRRLLETGIETLSLLLTRTWLERLLREGSSCNLGNTLIFLADEQLLREIVGYNIHEGILAIGRVPPEPCIENLPSPHLLVALDGLRSSENVGTIARNCAAFGVDSLIVGEFSCSPWLRRAVRSSMGAVFKLPVLHVSSLAESLLLLRRQFGTRIVAADPAAKTTIYEADMSGNLCIVLGNEDNGLTEPVISAATDRAAIPMQNQTDSLNVASASAVFLYAARCLRISSGPSSGRGK